MGPPSIITAVSRPTAPVHTYTGDHNTTYPHINDPRIRVLLGSLRLIRVAVQTRQNVVELLVHCRHFFVARDAPSGYLVQRYGKSVNLGHTHRNLAGEVRRLSALLSERTTHRREAALHHADDVTEGDVILLSVRRQPGLCVATRRAAPRQG